MWLREPHQSRVLAANPNFHMKSLIYAERRVTGPVRVDLRDLPYQPFLVLAAPLVSENSVDGERLLDLSGYISDHGFSGSVPEGRWLIAIYRLEETMGSQAGQIDLMNPDATRTYLRLVHDEYYKRFKEYFGTTLTTLFADHEGTYGYRIAWTPRLFDSFRKTKGYVLRKYLPLLLYDGGKITDKVRCDYIDTIAELYTNSYAKQV